MSNERVIVVALEDGATAGVVAVGAAHVAMEQAADRLILLHILDDHVITNSLTALMGLPEPLVESSTEGSSILRFAEEAIAAEYRAVNRPVPVVVRELGEGRAGPTIAQVAADAAATAIVVGARRPHAFGRFTHPDVVEYLQRHTAVPVHVVPLQAEPAQSILSPSSR